MRKKEREVKKEKEMKKEEKKRKRHYRLSLTFMIGEDMVLTVKYKENFKSEDD